MASIGIIGGMGPLATVRLFEEIVLNTQAARDQEHIRVLIDNNPQIPDRTASILMDGPDPSRAIVETAQNLLSLGADILVMPCNTAHFYADHITAVAGSRFINMVEETGRYVLSHFGKDTPAVLLATSGTLAGNVYGTVFARMGLTLVTPSADEQDTVMELIARIKGGQMDAPTAFIQLMEAFCRKDLDHFILGCTELSVADRLFKLPGVRIDPLHILARAAIRQADRLESRNRLVAETDAAELAYSAC